MNPIWMATKHELAFRRAQIARRLRSAPTRDLRQGPLRVYWWTDRVNFGDVLSGVVVSHVAGREVEWSPLETCDMISTGSIYGWLRIMAPRYHREVHVWGSGLQRPKQVHGRVEGIHHHLVRGPLTAMFTGHETLPMGDPGLIGPEAVGLPPEPSGDAKGVGIIPHRGQWSQADYMTHLSALPGAKMIDYRTEDCRGVIEEMASCERIYSTSLHGLVLADALGIPNFRFNEDRFSGDGHFKFFDYGLSVGRDLSRPVKIESHIREHRMRGSDTDYFENVPAVKRAIVDSFPHDVFGTTPKADVI